MKVYTLAHPHGDINQSIRDALNLPVHQRHARYLIPANNRMNAIYELRSRMFPHMKSSQVGLELAYGGDVDALRAAGLLDEPTVLVAPGDGFADLPVAVVEKGSIARMIGILAGPQIGCRWVSDTNDQEATRG